MIRFRQLLLCAGLLLLSGVAPLHAELQLQTGSCQEPPRLVVQGEPLSRVLRELGLAFEFSVAYRADTDPLVSGEFTEALPRMLKLLTTDMNVITVTGENARCPDETGIARLILLPVGETTERIEAVPENVQRYRRAHGMDPLTGELRKR